MFYMEKKKKKKHYFSVYRGKIKGKKKEGWKREYDWFVQVAIHVKEGLQLNVGGCWDAVFDISKEMREKELDGKSFFRFFFSYNTQQLLLMRFSIWPSRVKNSERKKRDITRWPCQPTNRLEVDGRRPKQTNILLPPPSTMTFITLPFYFFLLLLLLLLYSLQFS